MNDRPSKNSTEPSPASRSAAAQSIELAVDVRGAGYPILCLHGHPGRGLSMSVFTHHLSQRFLTLAPDLRGYGRSQVKTAFCMEDHLLDLEALLDRFQIENCLILGWSLGGILAMELSLRFPDRVSGLILVATAARPTGSHPPVSWVDEANTAIASILNALNPGWQWNIDTFGVRSLYRYLVRQHTPRTYRYLAAEAMPAYLQTSYAANQALNSALRQRYNRLTDLNRLTCPCLCLCGAEDRHITATSSLETAKHLVSSQTVCYQNVAHLFPWEIPDQVLQDIDTWLETTWNQPEVNLTPEDPA